MAQYLLTKENPLDELLEMMLNSITRNVVGYYNLKGLEEKERIEHREKEEASVELIAGQRKRIARETAEIKELKKELEEKELRIKNLEVKLEEAELKEKTHIEVFEVSERWNKTQKAELIKD